MAEIPRHLSEMTLIKHVSNAYYAARAVVWHILSQSDKVAYVNLSGKNIYDIAKRFGYDLKPKIISCMNPQDVFGNSKLKIVCIDSAEKLILEKGVNYITEILAKNVAESGKVLWLIVDIDCIDHLSEAHLTNHMENVYKTYRANSEEFILDIEKFSEPLPSYRYIFKLTKTGLKVIGVDKL